MTSLVAKRDKVLSDAIQMAIRKGLPIDNLSASKRDYEVDHCILTDVCRNVFRPRASWLLW